MKMPDPYVIIIKLFAKLPWKMVQSIGTGLGYGFYKLAAKRQRAAMANLRIAMPHLSEAEHTALAKKSFIEGGRTLMECSHVWIRPYEELARRIDDSDALPILEDIKNAGRPVILATPHIGNWEVAGLFLATHVKLTALYKPADTDIERVVKEARERTGAELATADMRGVRAALTALRKGNAVGVLPDQTVPEHSGTFATLFGRPAMTMTLINKLARKANADLYMISADRVPETGHFYIRLEKAQPGFDDENETVAAEALNRSVERCIMGNKEQYWWSYERYRRQPPGYDCPYQKPE